MSKAAQRRFASVANDPAREFVRVLRAFGAAHRPLTVFTDAVQMAACALSNAVDKSYFEVREARYLQIVAGYTPDQVEQLCQLFALLTMAMEREFAAGGPTDVLGAIFGLMEFGNDGAGQFFTPFPVSQLMARMLIGDPRQTIADQGYVSVMEPACGAGGMILAMAGALQDKGINYQRAMHVQAIDIDPLCVAMTYVQLSLAHIPAVVIHGNSLSMQIHDVWRTPAHILGRWGARLARPASGGHAVPELDVSVATPEPAKLEPAPAASAPVQAVQQPARLLEKAQQLGLF